MKKILLFSSVLLFVACVNRSGNTPTVSGEVENELATDAIDAESAGIPICTDSTQIRDFDEIRVDAANDGCKVICRIISNGKVIYSNNTPYADKNLILTIQRDDSTTPIKMIFERMNFGSIIPAAVIDEMQMYRVEIKHISQEYVEILLYIGEPETDFVFENLIKVHQNGNTEISGKELVMEEEL